MRTWVKLYTEILRDPKMHNLGDRPFRMCINLIALAGQLDENGRLGCPEDIAFHLRLDPSETTAILKELEEIRVTCNKKGIWWLKNWTKRNGKPISDSRQAVRDRVQKYRENKTNSNTVKRTGNAVTSALHDAGNAPRKDKNREEKKVLPGAQPAPDAPADDQVKNLALVFEEASGIVLSDIPKKSQGARYWDALRRMVAMANGSAPELLRTTIGKMRGQGLDLSAPASCLKTFTSIHGSRITGLMNPATSELSSMGYVDADGKPV